MSSPGFTDGECSAAKPAERRWHRLYFDDWAASEGLELIHGYKIENVYEVPLRHWARTGGNAVWMQLEGTGGFNGAYTSAKSRRVNSSRHCGTSMRRSSTSCHRRPLGADHRDAEGHWLRARQLPRGRLEGPAARYGLEGANVPREVAQGDMKHYLD